MKKSNKRKKAPSRRNMFIITGVLMTVLLIAVAQIRIPSQYRSQAQTPPLTNCTVNAADEAIDQEEQRMLQLVNNYRQAQGASPLKLSKTLTRAATWLSVDMNTSKNLNHTDSTGRDFVVRIVQCGFDGTSDAENISNLSVDAQQVIGAWGASPVHNSNLLNTYFTVVGISRSGNFWVLDFGSDFASGDSELSPSGTVPGPSSGQLPPPSNTVPSPGCLGSCPTTPSAAPSIVAPITDVPEDEEEEPTTPSVAPSGAQNPPAENPDETPNQNGGGLIELILNFLKKLLELLSSLLGN